MGSRWILVLAVLVLGACTTARMAVDPQLNENFDEYPLAKVAGKGAGFGPYRYFNLERSWTRGSGITIGRYRNQGKRQTYAFDFRGADTWRAECIMTGQGQQLGVVAFGEEIHLDCTFTQKSGNGTRFGFSFSGSRLVEARGTFGSGAGTFTVVPNLLIQGSPFAMGTPTGYQVYSGDRIVAAVDDVSGKGPVWLSRDLAPEVRDRVGAVLVALLLVQE